MILFALIQLPGCLLELSTECNIRLRLGSTYQRMQSLVVHMSIGITRLKSASWDRAEYQVGCIIPISVLKSLQSSDWANRLLNEVFSSAISEWPAEEFKFKIILTGLRFFLRRNILGWVNCVHWAGVKVRCEGQQM
jgi:hypothetical protein